MKRILFTILIIISLTGDSYSQRIPFAFWNRLDPDTLELDAPTLISPADDTTGVDQSPLLDWDGVLYATNYIVQLDNDTNFSPVSWTDTTVNSKATVELGLVQGTTWYWRVLAFNIFDTSEWSVTYSFTVTTGPALTTPVLLLPRDDTTNVIQYPVLDWDTVINVRHYVVQLSDTISFTDIYWSDSLTQSTSTVDSVLDYASTWYWRVRAYNDFDTSDWSAIYTFTVQDPTIAAPTLLTPTNGATGQSQSPTLVWSETDEADFYNVQLTQYSDFSSVLWNQNTFDTSRLVDMTLLEGTKWYWRARAINATDTSNWSSTFAFIVTEGSATPRAYYIDSTTGKDEYNGRSTTTPWQSISKVNAMSFIAGDTILFKGGNTFEGKINHTYTYDDTTKAITYGSYGTGKATILLGSADSDGLTVQMTKHIKLKITNLIIKGVYNSTSQTGGATTQRGIYIKHFTNITPIDSNKISQINISNCDIYNIKNNGILVTAGDYGKTLTCHIDSNTFYDIGLAGINFVYNWHSRSRIYGNTFYNIKGISTGDYASAVSISLCKDVLVERNLIYDIGQYSAVSGLGIVTGASKNIRVRYNEIYNIITNTGTDAEAIDFDLGTDSSIAEYNYIHNTQGIGILMSGGTSLASVTNNYLSYITERGSMDSGTCDYLVARYNVIKNFANTSVNGFSGIFLNSGAGYPTGGRGRNNQIYNNTIIHTHRPANNSTGLVIGGYNDSTKVFNNLIMSDSCAFVWTDSGTTMRYSYVNNNVFWDRTNSFTYFYRGAPTTGYTSIQSWNTALGWETTKYRYNPLLSNPFNTVGDTLNNPFLIETALTKYVPVDGSITKGLGVQLSSYTLSAPTADIRGLSISGNVGIGAFIDTTTSGYNYQPESKRWFARMDTLQTADQMKIKDSLIVFLKADSLLNKMDLFYLFANLDSQSAKTNIISDTFNLVTPIGAATFTTQQGFTGNGINSYFNTNWTPSSSAIKFLLDSSSISSYVLTNVNEASSVLGSGNSGADFIRISPRTSNFFNGVLNSTSISAVANTSSIGLFTVSRSASNSVSLYKNDSLYTTLTTASTQRPSFPLFILARNAAGGAVEVTTNQIGSVIAGGKLNQHSQIRLTDNLDWYFNKIGIPKTPVKPLLSSPANLDTGVSLTTDLRWENLNNANKYHIQISWYADFSSLIGEITDIDTCVYHVGGTNPGSVGGVTLLNNQINYWRVRATNSAGTGSWSSTFRFNTPATYDTTSIALFARMPYAISIERKDLIDSLIKQLKADTVWSKLDVLYLYAADDTSNAKLNWKSPSFTTTISGTTKPVLTANMGFTGNGTSAYLNTNWNPSTNGVNYRRDSASAFTYIRSSVNEAKYIFGAGGAGVSFCRLVPWNGGFIDSRMNDNTGNLTATTNGAGMYTLIRVSSSAFKIYKNDSLKNTASVTSSNVPPVNMFTLCRNGNGSAADFTTRQIAMFAAGGFFTDYTQTIIHRRFEWYLNRIGAYVFVPSYIILNTPANTATGVSISPDLDWDNVGANYYQIEIDDDIAFGSPFYSANTAGSEESGENVGELANNTTYYWRVRGVNTIGTGAWSSTYSFTTTP